MVYLNQTRLSAMSQTLVTENRFSLCLSPLSYFICKSNKGSNETVSSEFLLLVHATRINSPCTGPYIVLYLISILNVGAQGLSGRVLDSRPKGRGFEPHWHHSLVSLIKNINLSLVLVQPRKTRPFITERLLMGRKESNKQTNNPEYETCNAFVNRTR